jgi:hypothetical protein
MNRPAHARALNPAGQRLWLVFGGVADQPWLRALKPGFRHCFAAIEEAQGWLVVDPLSGRLLVTRIEVPGGFDLPGFYRRAGLVVIGPLQPGPPRASPLPWLSPMSCVSVCRALLGAGAPFALTPWGLFRRLAAARDHGLRAKVAENRKKVLTRPPGCA